MSGAKATGSDRLRASFDDTGRGLMVLVGVAFWGWLVGRWLYDWTLARVGIGPGAGESFLECAVRVSSRDV